MDTRLGGAEPEKAATGKPLDVKKQQALDEPAVTRGRATAKVCGAKPAHASFLANRELTSRV